ncbi:uncharacterized protein DNG_02388 [Cephalotrichum gorgonifer]|uniref:Sphingoid long-chain base transporter RSB1 n=1 Tax=Cephalotrichum gorgonifer TaxID=2041049 RepID=A0AAE8MTH2_9PEZI|nr:uncharacterized protein DNG_02388 [Cephalotrichum gorgonifer]
MTGDCTTTIGCPFPGGFLPYAPSLAANAFLVSAFAVVIPAALYLGYRSPALGFTVNLVTALLLEVLGFVGRLLLNRERDSRSYFALYLLGTALGTTAFVSAVFTVLPHILGVYGGKGALRAARINLVLLGLLVVIVVLEVVGVASAVFGLKGVVSTRVLVAALVIQILALALFVGIKGWFALGRRGLDTQFDPQHAHVYRSDKFRRFLFIIYLSVVLLLTTTIYRIVEITPSLSTEAARNEAAATILHGALPLLISILLTAFHPGHAFGSAWSKTTPRYLSQKKAPAPSTRSDNPYRAPEQKYAIRRVAPEPLSAASISAPYELYPRSPAAVGPSPTKSSHASSPGFSPAKGTFRSSLGQSVMSVPYNASPAQTPRSATHHMFPGHSPRTATYTTSPGHSPRSATYTVSPGHSPRTATHTISPGHSPRSATYAASPGHSPRKLPERDLVDDDALW